MGVKDELRVKFSKEYLKHYNVELFEREGFKRYKCKVCGSYFWSLVPSDTCGDASCEPYSFFKKDWKAGDYVGEWKKFAEYFAKNGHKVIKRYPVIARWRPDLHFTIASIVDFMRLENGKVVWEYPDNPLVVPQVCLRFPDIPNVGVTGRHHTSFIMAGQHAFNDGNIKYWKDETINYNFEYLTKVLGVPAEELRYKEDVWAMPDLSSFGPSLETFTRGMELVNSVFTQFTKTQSGQVRELDMKVIDVGWGFERLVWYASGAPTSYDASLGYAVEWMKKKVGLEYDRDLHMRYAHLAGALDIDDHEDVDKTMGEIASKLGVSVNELKEKLGPLEGIYAIADHTKTLLFALADGALPSNTGGGYNLRVILRRAQSYIDKYGFDFTLQDVSELHADYLKEMFPELKEATEFSEDVYKVEIEKYRKTIEKAKKRAVVLAKKGKIDDEVLMKEYESNGVTPEILKEVLGNKVELPEDFYSKLTEKHVFNEAKKKEEKKFNTEGLPKTEPLYYRHDELAYECEGKVLDVRDGAVVLDRTCFYPRSGGQEYDHGTINGTRVKEVYKYEGVIFHILESLDGIEKGATVKCKVDRERRDTLRRHHTATHIVGGICRQVLGKHVWQAGAHKDVDKATLDITHYKNLTEEEVEEIERRANEVVLKGLPVEVKEWDRGEAEQKYGFVLYQGGGSPGKRIRVVKVDDIDVEACGGLHVTNTSEIGLIKIMKVERIQDGVIRLTYCAGKPAIKYVQERERLLRNSAKVFSVVPSDLPKTSERFFKEWKELRKKVEQLEERLAEEMAKSVGNGVVEVDYSKDLMMRIAKWLVNSDKWVVMINREGMVVSVAGVKSGKNAKEEMDKVLKERGGTGGGKDRLAVGKIKI